MNDDQPFLTDDEIALHAQVRELRLEHADLEASIDALSHMPIPDQLLIARLKRKKLLLRDEIVKIESRILPDIIA
ncbi:YdcH family protein [Brevundimonas sp. TWP2-3-4b1]|uniref:YdcH family protein n=1 Tax=Brevundimonas sp. TWP2-3-4b1 TaxID=2804580 RepID=UPI003CF09238